MKILITMVLTTVVGMLAGIAFIYSGTYDAAADQPHGGLVFFLAETARERSIAVRAKNIDVPNLTDPKTIAAGASEYAEMCTGCHLAPGMKDNEMRPGLYPYPPNLGEHRYGKQQDPLDVQGSAARQFWIIKHGIKMSAMPAWGKTHDDATIWSMVAFLQTLPTLTPEQYAAMTQDSESSHEASGHGHMHDVEKADSDNIESKTKDHSLDEGHDHRH